MTKTHLLLTFLFVLCAVSQTTATPRGPTLHRNPATGEVAGVETSLSSLTHAAGTAVSAASVQTPEEIAYRFLELEKEDLGVRNPRAQFKVERIETDSIGISHVHLQQVISGVPVYGAQISVHINPSKDRITLNGKPSKTLEGSTVATIGSQDALKVAHDDWRKQYGDTPFEYQKAPILWALDLSLLDGAASGDFYLVYAVDLGAKKIANRYFVDAKTGSLLKVLSLTSKATQRWVYDCSFGDGNCYLDQYSWYWSYWFGRSEGQPARGDNPIPLTLITWFPKETDRLYDFLGAAHNYYGDKFGRNSANGAGGLGDGVSFPSNSIPAGSYADYEIPAIGCPNAMFNPMYSRLEFCTGLMLVDIVGHEFTHAVTYYSIFQNGQPAGLLYQNQSGALNESFSDIFGEAVERYLIGSHDWLLGSNSLEGTTLEGIFRSMSDPATAIYNPYYGNYSNGAQPDRFYSSLFYCGSDDNGGVHKNSGVLNHAAFLTAKGGTFNGCAITGLGDEKEERIFYRALTTYLQYTSSFYDAYLAVRNACVDLYSLEDCLEVEKALRAVELPQAGPCSGTPQADTQCSAVTDECPNNANQVVAAPCGCGVAVSDNNKNGVADCLDPNISGIKPTAPKVKASKKSLAITMTFMNGVSYRIRVSIAAKGKKSKTKYYNSSSVIKTLKNLPKGATVTISYYYMVDGTPVAYSKESAKRRAKIK